MKYRKKPIVIDAVQWIPGAEVEGVLQGSQGYGLIHTLEGVLDVWPGDYVITGIQGERYPCKTDIFEATYEPAE